MRCSCRACYDAAVARARLKVTFACGQIIGGEDENGQVKLSIRRLEFARAWERVRQIQVTYSMREFKLLAWYFFGGGEA